MKTCTRCNRSLPATLEYFNRQRNGLRSMCKECQRADYRAYFTANREAVRAKIRERDRAFQPERSRRQKEKRAANPEAAREADRLRRVRDRERINARMKRYNDALAQRPGHRLRKNVSTVMSRSLQDSKGGRSWEALVGYTIQELKAHLEALFLPGMSWENYGKGPGKWSLDHIRPVSSFSFSGPEDPDFRECWALSNLQPLWDSDNIRKGCKWAS